MNKKAAGKPTSHSSGSLALAQAREALTRGKIERAIQILKPLLDTTPPASDALRLRAQAAILQGHHAEAIPFLESCLNLQPEDDGVWCDAGTALHGLFRLPDAEAAYQRALTINPGNRDARYNLANVLRELGRPADALLHYTETLAADPSHALSWNNMGLALQEMKHLDEALSAFRQAAALRPYDGKAWQNIGNVLEMQGHPGQAIEEYRHGLIQAPDHPDLYVSLANALSQLGQIENTGRLLDKALALQPNHAVAHAARIFQLDFDDRCSTADQQAARKKWYRACIQPRRIVPLDHYRHPDPERLLRIGYVSADFFNTSAAMGFMPAIKYLDPDKFEVYCYSNRYQEDAVSAEIRTCSKAFHIIAGDSDEQAARRIAEDRIDILIDLSGHSRGNRLGIFAYRPAPIQGTAWGYCNGTGMPEMDFIFADPIYLPEQDLLHFTEKLVSLPAVIAYHHFVEPPPVGPLPALTQGHITFGSFCRLQKITPETIRLWSGVLAAMPASTLVLKASGEADRILLEALQQRFAQHGIAPERLEVLPKTSWNEHMKSFGKVDILLDAFPHGGGISLLEGLLMGVPTLTLCGSTPAGRLAASILTALGMTDWIAATPASFIAHAQELGSAPLHLEQLAKLRGDLRQRILKSPIGNPALYGAAVGAALRQMWREHCPVLVEERRKRLQKTRAQLATAIEKNCPPEGPDLLQALLAAAPDDAEALHLCGTKAVLLCQHRLAVRFFEQALSRAPERVDFWIDMGNALTEMREFSDAQAAFRQATLLSPGDPMAWLAHLNLGTCLLKASQPQEALEHLQEAERLHPRNPSILASQAYALEQLGKLDEAFVQVDKALAIAPRHANALQNKGRFLIDQGKIDAGVPLLESALAECPERHEIRIELFAWYEKQDRMQRISRLLGHQKRGSLPTPRQAFSELCQQVCDSYASRGIGSTGIIKMLLDSVGRLMEIESPIKHWLLEEILARNPDQLDAHVQKGIATHHDSHYAAAEREWAAGLERRDQLAAEQQLSGFPKRILDGSWMLAIGHIAMLDAYVKAMRLGRLPQRELWLTPNAGQKLPNGPYLDYWRPFVNIAPNDGSQGNFRPTTEAIGIPMEQAKLITDHFFALRMPDGRTLWHQSFWAEIQQAWEAEQRPPLLQLTEADREYGQGVLRKLGVPADAWYVGLHVREPGFWWKWNRNHVATRDATIDAYRGAIDAIVARGGRVIRMGDPSMKPLPDVPGLIDYAHSPEKSARMDIFLLGSCRFFVGVNSGPSVIPQTFGIPCVLTNFAPLSIPLPSLADVMVPKLARSRKTGQWLDFAAMFECGAADAQFESALPEEIELVENDPDDLRLAVEEMLDRLDGHQDAAELADFAALRQSYQDIAKGYATFVGSPLSGRFLQKYRALLDSSR